MTLREDLLNDINDARARLEGREVPVRDAPADPAPVESAVPPAAPVAEPVDVDQPVLNEMLSILKPQPKE